MQTKTKTDKELIEMIKSGGHRRNEALKSLYLRPSLRQSTYKALSAMGAQESDIHDTFQDSLIIFDKNIRSGKFDGRSSLQTYFVAIAKWHQLSKLRKQKKTELLEDMTSYDGPIEDHNENVLNTEEKIFAMRKTLEMIGEKCKTLLLLYMQNTAMKEIAEKKGINLQSAKNAVHRCRKKLRELIAKEPQWKNLLSKEK